MTNTQHLHVYIASPYTIGDVAVNVHTSFQAAAYLRTLGALPFAPLRSHFEHMAFPQHYEHWMLEDFEYIRMSHALWRLNGISPGADREVEFADSLNIPVFYHTKSHITEWINSQLLSGQFTPIYSCRVTLPISHIPKGGETP